VIRVAIFEDNAELRTNLASFLNWDDGIEVVGQFPNVLNVEENMLVTMPDVVIMDIDMPGMTGIEGIKRLRKVSDKAQVMMLTVFEDDENIFAALHAGANGYLLKKTPPAQILDAVKELNQNGSPMSGKIARRVLQHFQPAPAKNDPKETLTQREREILDLLVKGNSYKMIAASFSISQNTVRNHIHNIYDKLHVNSATEAAYKAFGK
jgi:DNA-binding NarL/FixJ family response regulator